MWHRLELNQQGLDDAALARQRRAGLLERVRRGVYDEVSPALTPEQRHRRLIDATAPVLGPGAILSHHSAGVLHGLPVTDGHLGRVAVTRKGRASGTRTSGAVETHRRQSIRSVTVEGLQVTSLSDTAIDLACRGSFPGAVAVMDAALRQGTDRASIELGLNRLRRVGNPQARRALWSADPRSESVGESHSRVVMSQLGMPAPVLQYEIRDAQGVMRTDFAWPALRVVGEFDGWIKYGRLLKPDQRIEDVIRAERAREVRLEQQGWLIVRWVWSDLQEPDRLRAKLSVALRHAG